MSDRVELIAEVGSNFEGDLDLAKRYVAAAAGAGAAAVKFQTLTRETLMAPEVFDAEAGAWVGNPRYASFSNVGLPDAWHEPLKRCAEDEGVEFLSTPFHLDAVDLLESIGVTRYKLASGDLTFEPLQDKVGATGKPVLLSTGASRLDEVEAALARLDEAGSGPVTVLHCTASYPPSFEELNLRAIATLRDAFGREVGLSDHSPGVTAAIAAATLGARVIEKHVTFDRARSGPDHPFAMEMGEFAALAQSLRDLEAALGDGVKRPMPSEAPRRPRLRRGIYDPETFRPADDGIWLRPETK